MVSGMDIVKKELSKASSEQCSTVSRVNEHACTEQQTRLKKNKGVMAV